MHVSINGKDISEFGIVPLDGFINALLKPAGFKKLVTNSNAAFDGVIPVVSGARKRNSRNVTLNFLLRSTSLVDIQRDIDALESELSSGLSNSGITELYVSELDKYYHFVYDGMTSYKGVSGEKTIIALKFVEYCPTDANRVQNT